MEWVWASLVVLGAILAAICLFPVHLYIRFARKDEQDQIEIRIKAMLGLIRYTIVMPVVDLVTITNRQVQIRTKTKKGIGEGHKKSRPLMTITIDKIRAFFELQVLLKEKLHQFMPHIRSATKVFHIEKLYWKTEIGVGDAALTGSATGIILAIKGTLLGILSRFFSLQQKPSFSVQPYFHTAYFRTQVDCIIRFSLGQAILAGIKLFIYLLREGKKPWRIIRSKV